MAAVSDAAVRFSLSLSFFFFLNIFCHLLFDLIFV